jgi:hypothetical protein
MMHLFKRGEAQEPDYLDHRKHRPMISRPEMDFTGDAKLSTFGCELGVLAASDEFEAERRRIRARCIAGR